MSLFQDDAPQWLPVSCNVILRRGCSLSGAPPFTCFHTESGQKYPVDMRISWSVVALKLTDADALRVFVPPLVVDRFFRASD